MSQALRDLSQNPYQRPLYSKHGRLQTLIRGMGSIVIPEAEHGYRHFTAPELWTAMGFPIREDAQRVVGAACQFSDGRPRAKCRSTRSQRQQLGNTMHCNFIGAAILHAVLRFPSLGSRNVECQLAAEPSGGDARQQSREAGQKRSAPESPLATKRPRSSFQDAFRKLHGTPRE